MPSAGDAPDLTIRVAARFEEVRTLAAALQGFCAENAVPADSAIDLELALVEAANNVVQHGYAMQDGGFIAMSANLAGSAVTLTLTDGGTPMPEMALNGGRAQAPHHAESGRGMGIIMACVDEVDYRPGSDGNRLRMVKRLAAAA